MCFYVVVNLFFTATLNCNQQLTYEYDYNCILQNSIQAINAYQGTCFIFFVIDCKCYSLECKVKRDKATNPFTSTKHTTGINLGSLVVWQNNSLVYSAFSEVLSLTISKYARSRIV